MNDEELQEALVGRLRLLSRGEPDLAPDVRSAQRARLVAMAAVRPTGEVRSPEARPGRWRRLVAARAVDAPVARWRTRLTAGLAGAAMTVGALSGLTALAQGAEPGDLLYGLKRGSEDTRLALASDADRGLTLLGFASNRLTELADLTGSDVGASPVSVGPADASGLAVAASGVDAGTVVDVLTTMDDQTTEGTSWLATTALETRDTAAFSTLSRWAGQQHAGVAALDVPSGAEEARSEALALVDEVAARATALQATLQCPAGVTAPGTDRLGPLPGECLAVAPTPSSSAAPSTEPDQGATPAPGTVSGQAPASSAAGATTAAPSGGSGGTGGAATPSTTAAAPTTVPALPTTVPSTTVPPLVDVPLPLPSTTICVGGLICVGG
ncbi:hypothetical protein SAMN05660199_00573 [Klenkia soli]|uniref:Uncharacterized protein n=1 Tax=Klenkia soli TaxID=1052260 RepID=A0A1H0DC37_9ACTN|nr:hypothetical protein [Klenkia soli]SDN67730.1 hypothetical protein SAMN05660199_00573 [Klenkia soli]